MDGMGQRIKRTIANDRPIRHETSCECGGSFYAAPSARFATCSGGEKRCTVCHREARKFGRGGLTCGVGCTPKQ